MRKIELEAGFLQTIDWLCDGIVDWGSAGSLYKMDGTVKRLYTESFTGRFDGSIHSVNGRYAFIYQRNGTKGLLLKEGELLREINRSYYCAEVYEYPAAFVSIDSKTYLIHCPVAYNQLDFEDVETGELITNIPGRKPADIFHSRLEISPDNNILMCKSWVWHPIDVIEVFNIKDCLHDPKLLDACSYHLLPNGAEMCTASFIDSQNILIGTSDEPIDDGEEKDVIPSKHIAVWNIVTKQLSQPVSIDTEFGNLFAINEHIAWDLYKYPKVIDIHSGQILDRDEGIDTGEQCSSIIGNANSPQIIFNRQTKHIAIAGKEKITVLVPDID